MTIPYSEFHQTLVGGEVLGDNTTDQAYWLANAGPNHTLGKGPNYCAEFGHFTVSFDKTGVTITNTCGFAWKGGKIVVNLDRLSALPERDSAKASPATVPIPRPASGSSAYQTATSGLVAPTDFLLEDRDSRPSKGAVNDKKKL